MSISAVPQAQNWCQAMCLNPARTRRRLKRLLEDWHNLGGHAALADGAPEVTAALDGAGWRWQGLGADDPQVGCHPEATCMQSVPHLMMGSDRLPLPIRDVIAPALCRCSRFGWLLGSPPGNVKVVLHRHAR